ncbi:MULTISPECIES: bifunctional serine/threonine-protein kinase/formylglycine-generating enzyme family protein [Nitrincola]|uniref:Serine/threonine-protein kinase C n=1 Tax=Nitrincola nitratireducens TaxID=1229521 RepID=W9VEC2_9GAMM|nr:MULTISPECIES: bifunctional serine/threonine-protein kinase/formylglycine-generating enzyme family protein [Nitrincola]EXJ09060.1 Serine/threonine-protein kinase C [Nitrincola nitratireducens]
MSKLEFNQRTLPQGFKLGDYLINDLLGQGGFGIAYLAQDIHLKNQVVIKEYFPNELASRDGQTVSVMGTDRHIDYEKGMQRFLEEGRALARFNHPTVVRILKYFQQNNTAYLVMEFVDGESLDRYLKRKYTLTPEVVEYLAKELLNGLEVVHQHGLIHRDIKPANIMLRTNGHPVLIDFGAAKEVIGERSNSVVVTPGYGSPEQYSSKSILKPSTDLYAVGATLYKCLTAQTPEEASARLLDDDHKPLRELPLARKCAPQLVTLIDNCMRLKSIERPQSAQEAIELLTVVEQEKSILLTVLDSSSLETMIECAESNGVITQRKVNQIILKAKKQGFDTEEVKAKVTRLAEEKGWVIESKFNKSFLLMVIFCVLLLVGYYQYKLFESMPESNPISDQESDLQQLVQYKQQEDIINKNELVSIPQPIQSLLSSMVIIPSGEFQMGCSQEDNSCYYGEGPVRNVQVAGFKIGKMPITFAQWDACVSAGGCSYQPNDVGWGRDDRPVIHVSYNHVTQEFIPWLNRVSGQSFRLPSEAEWEYVARAGTTERYGHFGSCITTLEANYDGNYDVSGCPESKTGNYLNRTQTVGTYSPNSWGVQDMLGNIWEWTDDCWSDSYTGALSDGQARTDGDCTRRVLRGGSWFNGPWSLRVSNRYRNNVAYGNNVGFRVVLVL